ncbi:MAG: putative phage protein [Herbinix sp.]|jgi:uncharacterized phage protein (predicted DNA packaging)|nr:putative phage protein [Herbinix sp.]
MEKSEAKEYLRVDGDYDDTYITEIIEISQIYIESCVGTAYQIDEKAVKLAKLLQKKLLADMYDQRGTEIPTNTKQDKITQSILDKLSNYQATT